MYSAKEQPERVPWRIQQKKVKSQYYTYIVFLWCSHAFSVVFLCLSGSNEKGICMENIDQPWRDQPKKCTGVCVKTEWGRSDQQTSQSSQPSSQPAAPIDQRLQKPSIWISVFKWATFSPEIHHATTKRKRPKWQQQLVNLLQWKTCSGVPAWNWKAQ